MFVGVVERDATEEQVRYRWIFTFFSEMKSAKRAA